MPKSTIIACALHDYIEIACLYGYQLKLELKNQQTLEGKAIDVVTSADKKECLLLESEQQIKIELTAIKELQVLTPQAKFHTVTFSST
jgi:Rho-binding antiterminator